MFQKEFEAEQANKPKTQLAIFQMQQKQKLKDYDHDTCVKK